MHPPSTKHPFDAAGIAQRKGNGTGAGFAQPRLALLY